MVDELAGRFVERDEGGGDEAGGRIHIAVRSWKKNRAVRRADESLANHMLHELQIDAVICIFAFIIVKLKHTEI